MPRRNLTAAAVVILALAGLVVWKLRGHDEPATQETAATGGSTARLPVTSQPRPDPKSLGRASIAGTITVEGGGPIAHARVCARGSSNDLASDLLREPVCTESDDAGTYSLANLYPAKYSVSASAKTYRPASHHVGGDRRKSQLVLAANAAKIGIDIALRPGGVEITGVVLDLTGGPVGNARVGAFTGGWRRDGAMVTGETDAQGMFSLWVSPGDVQVSASADGYADSMETGTAPGKLEILLTPESSLAGTVVDASTNQPIEGARVTVEASEFSFDSMHAQSNFSDAEGKFRIARLKPGRYVSASRTDRGFGRTEGSTLVGLGQHVDGVVVKLWPAFRIDGKVVIAATKAPCDEPNVLLRSSARNAWLSDARKAADGALYFEGVLPGTYQVSASCEGYQSREKYEPVTITDKDATGLIWEVDAGASVRGKVVTKSGEPVEGSIVWARTVGGAPRAKSGWSGDASARDGTYELTGLKPGSYKIDVNSDRGAGPKDGVTVEVAAGAAVVKDLVLDEAGTIKGTVVDPEGKPVPGLDVFASSAGQYGGDSHKSDEAGNFTLFPIRPGDYRVVATRGWLDRLRKPGTTDDAKQGEKVSVRGGQTATVRLVVESQSGAISGTVVDAAGKPVTDAYVSAARESDAAGAQKSSVQSTRWNWDERPVLTGTDGAFTVGKLAPGTYTVRAYRKGGGEAIAEHVAIGGSAKLQIRPVGSIEGVVKTAAGPVPDEIEVTVKDLAIGFSRDEKFFKTEGRFAIRDLPKGHFQIEAHAEGGSKTAEVDLGEGEAKIGVTLELEAHVTITGRLVELGTTKPVPGVRMMAMLAKGGGGFSFSTDDDMAMITDEAGRFTVKDAPTGRLTIRAWPKDPTSEYTSTTALRTVQGTGTVDVGDVAILRRRVKRGDPVGDLGVNWASQPPDTEPDKRELKVSFVDPAGPAAKTDLKVGDIVKTIDGVDITGEASGYARSLIAAPPGTKLVFGLVRGASVTIVLAAP
ncbi:MAG: carboxypeptidase regulatory-like domain-containing protein [Kofleriaceae bacterium]